MVRLRVGQSSSSAGTYTVLLYEPLSNHGDDGINVLLAIGVENYEPSEGTAVRIVDVQAGKNPPNVTGLGK